MLVKHNELHTSKWHTFVPFPDIFLDKFLHKNVTDTIFQQGIFLIQFFLMSKVAGRQTTQNTEDPIPVPDQNRDHSP